ncbi:MAG: N-acetyltransferase [Clostridia bacterium]|jgi:predicted GNAT family acetyltransferase|nr:N-acetyltransferase [Clostridia bacterium]
MIDIKFIKKENRAVAYDNEVEMGECEFEELEDTWNITHTVVNSKYQGQGIAKKLVKCVIQNSQQYDKKIIAECSYAKKVLQIKE